MDRRIPLVDLREQHRSLNDEIDRAIRSVIADGRFILGCEVEKFESEFAEYCGAAFCVACANGTDALTLALRAAGVGPGDEVVTVAMTCAPTATGILRAGARPVFVDVEDESLTMDPALLEASLTERTRAVVPVHLYGRPAR